MEGGRDGMMEGAAGAAEDVIGGRVATGAGDELAGAPLVAETVLALMRLFFYKKIRLWRGDTKAGRTAGPFYSGFTQYNIMFPSLEAFFFLLHENAPTHAGRRAMHC